MVGEMNIHLASCSSDFCASSLHRPNLFRLGTASFSFRQNAALSACEGTGHWQESLTFLMEMKLEAGEGICAMALFS